MNIVGTVLVSQSIQNSKKTMTSDMMSGHVVERDSLSISETITNIGTPPLTVLDQEIATCKGLKLTSGITSTHTVTHLRMALRAMSLIVAVSTEKKFGLRRAVRGAAFAHLPAGYAAKVTIPTALAATDLMSLMPDMVLRGLILGARENTQRVTVPIAQEARHADTGPMKRVKKRTFSIDAEKSLRKIRSEAQILLSRISEPEDESMETDVRHSGTAKEPRPAGLSVPSSATSLTGETSPERTRLSAKEKGKGKASANAFEQSEAQRPSKSHHSVTRTRRDHRQHEQTSPSGRPKAAALDKGKDKEVAEKESEMAHPTRASTQQHSAKSRRPTAEKGGEHQCDWKSKYDTLKSEVEKGRPGQAFGVDEVSHDHQCEWKDKYLALEPKAEDGQGQQQQADLGLEGLTIVLHMRGKDDLVINTDLRDLDQ
ncbi:hypothetical protein Daus18300_011528 [Diaporthe australafricana]|uniref:Uncharacterized protein n=1 Tax=Diaporthe australafricana TaxID=127596 RepID=A0ABR3W6K1_9PEZI